VFQPKTRLFEAMVGVADKMGYGEKKKVKWSLELEFFKAEFLVLGIEVAQETRRPASFPSKKCCRVGNRVIFSSMLEILNWRNLGRSRSPGQ
jgi:hypothetical protein